MASNYWWICCWSLEARYCNFCWLTRILTWKSLENPYHRATHSTKFTKTITMGFQSLLFIYFVPYWMILRFYFTTELEIFHYLQVSMLFILLQIKNGSDPTDIKLCNWNWNETQWLGNLDNEVEVWFISDFIFQEAGFRVLYDISFPPDEGIVDKGILCVAVCMCAGILITGANEYYQVPLKTKLCDWNLTYSPVQVQSDISAPITLVRFKGTCILCH